MIEELTESLWVLMACSFVLGGLCCHLLHELIEWLIEKDSESKTTNRDSHGDRMKTSEENLTIAIVALEQIRDNYRGSRASEIAEAALEVIEEDNEPGLNMVSTDKADYESSPNSK